MGVCVCVFALHVIVYCTVEDANCGYAGRCILRSSLLAFNSDIIAHSGYIKRIRASLLVFDIMVTFVLLESILRLESFLQNLGTRPS